MYPHTRPYLVLALALAYQQCPNKRVGRHHHQDSRSTSSSLNKHRRHSKHQSSKNPSGSHKSEYKNVGSAEVSMVVVVVEGSGAK